MSTVSVYEAIIDSGGNGRLTHRRISRYLTPVNASETKLVERRRLLWKSIRPQGRLRSPRPAMSVLHKPARPQAGLGLVRKGGMMLPIQGIAQWTNTQTTLADGIGYS